MEEEQESAHQISSVDCEECKSKPWKYKCPGCSIRTCSLPCINSHKQRTDCNGKKSITHVLSLTQFDDNLLLSAGARLMNGLIEEYRKVEEVSYIRLSLDKVKEKIEKLRERKELGSHRERRSLVTFLCYMHDALDQLLTTKFLLLRQCLIPMKQQLICCYKLPAEHEVWRFREHLNIKAPLREQLANKVILEYPVIYVFLPSHSFDFEVIKYSVPRKSELKEVDCSDSPSPRGVMFREEDIGDGGSSDPHI
ncbi:hypothetical protein RND71_007579 [Anisodus tanguticus]|uniref:Box C/D snoRNA protein 1 n=1 Tax=Anisodus tanguticus TaxID=243964 RepID=A0AAE1SLM6_9SOLA|nr:hypothetical protein RND71_007579 [Anisodus tanguticus]